MSYTFGLEKGVKSGSTLWFLGRQGPEEGWKNDARWRPQHDKGSASRQATICSLYLWPLGAGFLVVSFIRSPISYDMWEGSGVRGCHIVNEHILAGYHYIGGSLLLG